MDLENSMVDFQWIRYHRMIRTTFDCVDHNKLWKALKVMITPDHLTCFLRNLDAGQEATVRALYGTTDWFKIENRGQ